MRRQLSALVASMVILSLTIGLLNQASATMAVAQEAPGYQYFFDGTDVIGTGCYEYYGQFWPSKGMFQTSSDGLEYGAVLHFQLTQAEKDALLCVGEYLEIDFKLGGFEPPVGRIWGWDDYAIRSNIPGAIHDTALFDTPLFNIDAQTPGATRIRVSDLKVGFEYYAMITFNGLKLNGDGVPRVSVEWVPSHWASLTDEVSFCAASRWMSDAMCVFPTMRVYLSSGYAILAYGEDQALVFDGYRIWEFGNDSPSEMPTVDAMPLPTIADSFTCGDAGVPQITEGLSYSPGSPDTKTTVEFAFTITNIGCGTFRPEVLAIGGRNPRSEVSDPLQLREFVLGPGESRRITQSAVLDIAGTHEFFMVFLRSGGGWNEIPDTSGVSQHIYINVTEAVDPPADTSSDNDPAPPPTTEPVPTPVPDQQYALIDIGAVGPNGHEIGAQFTVTTLDGTWLGACTLQGSGGEPYLISCEVDVPRGTTVVVTLDTNTITPGYMPVENPLYFDTSTDPGAASYWGVVFELEAQGGSSAVASNAQSSDIAIETFLDGGPYYDACYVLVGYSLEGCDANRDGMITFADIPVGTYTVTQTAALPSGYSIPDFTITVTGSGQTGTEIFAAYGNSGSGSAPAVSSSSGHSGAVNIALITRDPVDGHLLTDVCYVLAGYSLEGCDENGDGQVTFADIPLGTYTVQQTRTPAGYPTVEDFEIHVQGTGYLEGPSIAVPLNFVVKQAAQQNAPNARNVSVVFLDMSTMERVTTGVCVQLVGASLVGCDEDLIDGQVDFLDVPGGGPYELVFSNLPAGSEVATVGGPLAITVPAGSSDPANVIVFVLLAGVDSGGSSTIQPRD